MLGRCSGGHVFVEEFIEKETATPASVPALTPSHSALPVPKVAYGRSIGLREGDIIVAVNGVNCLDVKVVDPPPPAYNEISKDVPENPPPNVFQCWERFRETLQGIVAKGYVHVLRKGVAALEATLSSSNASLCAVRARL